MTWAIFPLASSTLSRYTDLLSFLAEETSEFKAFEVSESKALQFFHVINLSISTNIDERDVTESILIFFKVFLHFFKGLQLG